MSYIKSLVIITKIRSPSQCYTLLYASSLLSTHLKKSHSNLSPSSAKPLIFHLVLVYQICISICKIVPWVSLAVELFLRSQPVPINIPDMHRRRAIIESSDSDSSEDHVALAQKIKRKSLQRYFFLLPNILWMLYVF